MTAGRRCAVLMYHAFDAPRDPREASLCCTPQRLDEHLGWLRSRGFEFISLERLVDAFMLPDTLPPNAVVLTIDDGLSCAYEAALPVLARHRVPATVFVVSGMLDGRAEWLARHSLPERRMLSTTELRALAEAGIDIGSHTVSHVRLAGLPAGRVRTELYASKARLEDTLGRAVQHFAYPYSSLDDGAEALVEATGYRAACAGTSGHNGPQARRFAIERIEAYGTDSPRRLEWKMRAGSHDFPPISLARRHARRALTRLGILPPRQP